MDLKKETSGIVLAGVVIGILASLLVFFGNPVNMGFCIACFLRDTAGALGLHSAAPVQYIRPEIIGLVLGSFLLALTRKELSARGGSAPGGMILPRPPHGGRKIRNENATYEKICRAHGGCLGTGSRRRTRQAAIIRG